MTIASTIAPSTGLKHGPSSHPRATSRRATPVAHASLSRRASLLALTTATTTALSTANPTPASASVVHVNIPVAELSPLQLTAQRNAYQAQAETVLRAKLTADDLGPAFRLLFRDAADFDAPNQAGGLDGSVVSSPGADLKGIVATLTDAKKEIDGQAGAAGPISWSDLMCLAVKVACKKGFYQKALQESGGNEEKASQLLAFAPAFEPFYFGRRDGADGAKGKGKGKTVPSDDAGAEEIAAFLDLLGNKNPDEPTSATSGSPFDKKSFISGKFAYLAWTMQAQDRATAEEKLAAAYPTFAAAKKTYDLSRASVTQTTYVVDLATVVNQLASSRLGATVDKTAYCTPLEYDQTIKF